MFRSGFMGHSMISTLMQKPGEVKLAEEPEPGYYPDAGFTIITGVKRQKSASVPVGR
jgi:hypothetical protein